MGDLLRLSAPAATPSTPTSSAPTPVAPAAGPHAPAAREPLFREASGRVLRRYRQERGERLAETAARAGVSLPYLSEVERGVKEPSSEVLSAVAGALGLTLLDLTTEVARDLRAAQQAAPRPRGTLALAA
ncbi:helix-turn-helix domain-containing protein [Nocardioides bruguierae]|uniref:Helix-turn-helix domain-containing protein n=1 Tax=Nocardioides bruguierae TaxID=2945102 RepID=A0A9X2IFR4_9ACTN|nr:helix-turn-helix transcriptional regulator [Nocardioides bruguierae]MCM0620005.1 helix-turn-helix domain-containing protein [Nocardioides bruguierae]